MMALSPLDLLPLAVVGPWSRPHAGAGVAAGGSMALPPIRRRPPGVRQPRGFVPVGFVPENVEYHGRVPSQPSEVHTRLADIFREKERYLEEKRRRADHADEARRSHAAAFHDVVVKAALPAFEVVGAGLAAYGLEHRIKRVGLLDGGSFEAEQQVTFEFRVADDAASSGPLLGRAFLRLSTDVESKAFRLQTEIAGGPDTPFAGSSSDTREVELEELDGSFFEAAALDLVERAVRSTYLDPDEAPGTYERGRKSGRASQPSASRDEASGEGASASMSASASRIGT